MMLMTMIAAVGLEKLALMDSLDMACWTDVEKEWGTVNLIEDCLRTGANGVLWRDKGGGGWMRYPSKEELTPISGEYVTDKRRTLPPFGTYWALRLDNLDFDVFDFVFKECAKRKVIYGIHQTFEECHTSNSSQSMWTIRHPQYWHCQKGGVPYAGHCSLAYPEVMEHKLRFADEHIAMKPQKIFLDIWRCGSWATNKEYVKPNIEEWNRRYPGEKLPEWDDPRWTEIVAGPMMHYIREYGRKCREAGVEFILGLPCSNQGSCRVNFAKIPDGNLNIDVNGICLKQLYALDYKQLCKEGAIDGVWVMDVPRDTKDVWGHLKAVLKHVKDNASGKKCYFGVNAYNIRHESYKDYAHDAKCSKGEAVHKMLDILTELNYDGAVLECVDRHCYLEKDVCEELRRNKAITDGEAPAISKDGKYLAFTRWEGLNNHLGVMNLENGEVEWIVRGTTAATKNEKACHPAWGPNGELIFAYANIQHCV